MLISSSSRYSIYKVQKTSCSSQRPDYLITSCRICQALFSSFFKFFQILFDVVSCSELSFFIAQLDYLITDLFVCQELFHFFSNFFLLSVALAGNLHILAHQFPFVKNFFKFFQISTFAICFSAAPWATFIYYHSPCYLSSTILVFSFFPPYSIHYIISQTS